MTTVTQDTANAILLLSGNNSYAGGTTIKAGTLDIGTNATAAGVGGIFIGNSSGSSTATLKVHNNLTFANALTVQRQWWHEVHRLDDKFGYPHLLRRRHAER